MSYSRIDLPSGFTFHRVDSSSNLLCWLQCEWQPPADLSGRTARSKRDRGHAVTKIVVDELRARHRSCSCLREQRFDLAGVRHRHDHDGVRLAMPAREQVRMRDGKRMRDVDRLRALQTRRKIRTDDDVELLRLVDGLDGRLAGVFSDDRCSYASWFMVTRSYAWGSTPSSSISPSPYQPRRTSRYSRTACTRS